jgi:hypothetical protein
MRFYLKARSGDSRLPPPPIPLEGALRRDDLLKTDVVSEAILPGAGELLAVGLALFCLRYMVLEDRWSDRSAKMSFWSRNLGLAWMVFATLFPLGILQLYHSVNSGYFDARSLKFMTNKSNALLEWVRFPGDALFIVGGVLPILYLSWLGSVTWLLDSLSINRMKSSFTEVVGPKESR